MSVTTRVTWDGDAVIRGTHEAAARGIRLGTEHLLQVSRRRVPIEEGTLERSGTATVDATALVGHVSYDTPYAVEQHENMRIRHDPGRTAKYLEIPAAEEARVIGEIIAAQVRRSMR